MIPTMDQRVGWGRDAVRTNPDFEQNELSTNIGDVLANIMHLCAVEDIDFEQCLSTAEMYVNYENDEERELAEELEDNELYCHESTEPTD